ncbi:MAG: hypothetical protein AB1530_07650 [Candidatus Omnitrophota bacterium]
MKRGFLVLAFLVFLSVVSKNSAFQKFWNHFWAISEEYSDNQPQVSIQSANTKGSEARHYNNPIDIFASNQIKYKFEKRSFLTINDQAQYEITFQ